MERDVEVGQVLDQDDEEMHRIAVGWRLEQTDVELFVSVALDSERYVVVAIILDCMLDRWRASRWRCSSTRTT